MKLLAIDTSGKFLSISLLEDKKLYLEFNRFAPNIHSQIIVKTVDLLLKELNWEINQLNKICVTTGPGSFTGIRIGITYARTLCQWLKIPVVGITTLDVLSRGVRILPSQDCLIIPIIDALNERVFVSIYDGISREKITDYKLDNIESVLKILKKKKKRCVFVGDGLLNEKILTKIKNSKLQMDIDFSEVFPRSSVLGMLGFEKKGMDYTKLKPFYLKSLFVKVKP